MNIFLQKNKHYELFKIITHDRFKQETILHPIALLLMCLPKFAQKFL